MNPSKSAIESAASLRNQAKFDEAMLILRAAIEVDPENPDLHYQAGWTYDASDRCDLAIPYYKKAMELDLLSDRKGCYLALGSSLRATGHYEEAHMTLKAGIQEFPDSQALRVFYAMTLYNLKKSKDAVASLLTILAETTSDREIAAYVPAVRAYAEDLDATLQPS